ncbi:uncharacterized protein BT62DRAFT_935791, partial [Guyanagaster necrorhizus]
VILSELEGDTPSLLACSLTCRSFLSPSRRQIFSAVSFANADHIRRFYVICAESPEISSCVNHLLLQNFSSWSVTADEHLTPIVKSLVNLESLTLHDLSFRDLSKELTTMLCSCELKFLALVDLTVDDTQALCSFLRHCHQLHTFSISGDLILSNSQTDVSMCEDNDPSAVSSLRHLVITCTRGSRRLLDTILTYPTPPVRIDRLEHLTIHMQYDGDHYVHLSVENLSLLKRIIDLNHDNDTLVHVSASFILTYIDSHTPSLFDLPLSHLRAISLYLGDFPDILEVSPLPILDWWTNALRPSPNVPTRLESLTIRLYLDGHGTHFRSSAGKEAWANLDSVLGDDSYPLRRLTIRLMGGKDSPLGEISTALDVMENVIRESMPRLVQKGALYFTKDFV